ncbi:ATP-binding protein [Terrisporobacter glycolicus]|nr:ATP-binding protein [Terrisporobacter glycolicus]
MNVKEVINLIVESVNQEKKIFKYKDMILIGENTSGKSKIIKECIKKMNYNDVYFIDSNNRVILTDDTQRLMNDEFCKFKVQDIVRCRIKKDYFNKKDVFSEDSGGEIILGELINHNSKYTKLFFEVLEIDMVYENLEESNFITDEVEQVYINKTNLREISSGIQSMLRILMEVNFAYENKCKVIFIDEFNSNLDYNASADFFIRLRCKYPNIRFIISSHDIYTLKGVYDADIVRVYKHYEKVEENMCEFFDSNDLDNIEMIDRKLFTGTTDSNQKKEYDIILATLLKKVILDNNIETEEKQYLSEMDNLTLRQELIKNYILERI